MPPWPEVSEFIGLTTAEAEKLAAKEGWLLRNWSKIAAGTMDLRTKRVNIKTENDIVISAEEY